MSFWCTRKTVLVVLFSVFLLQLAKCEITISTHQLLIKLHEVQTFNVSVTDLNETNVEITFHAQHDDVIKTDPNTISLEPGTHTYEINVTGLGAGHTVLIAQALQDVNVNDIYVAATVYKSNEINILSIVVGWTYFISWSLSFYPQIFTNYKRRSVIGFDLDFVILNLIGYVSYTIFTLFLYYIPSVIDEYLNRHPRGLIPVTFNDNAFNIHGLSAIILTIIQCVVYERGNQRISLIATIIIGVIVLFYVVTIFLVIFKCIHLLDFLYFCSYVKLLITLLKYVPQAFLNYRRKSTEGWSIGGVFLDLCGGVFSVMQMVLDAYNYDDWIAIFGNASKFGLGLFSILFQFIFVLQHYVLYKHSLFLVKLLSLGAFLIVMRFMSMISFCGGLNLDYLTFNGIGFVSYTLFTMSLYYAPAIIDEYENRYPTSQIPVTFQDNAFNILSLFAMSFLIYQCVIYERGNQRISIVATIIIGVIVVSYGVAILLSILETIHWLDFLYFCSYVKLGITLIKFVPQAYLNYNRKSTVGWSIGRTLLDLSGGIFSILQMMLNAYNYDDWITIFSNLSKFGLGLFTVSFQILFVVQHYILYRHSGKDAVKA